MSTLKAANIQNTGSGAPTFKNSSGTEIGQLARAWVTMEAFGTVSIEDDYNVSSITDESTGHFIINFTNSLPNSNYALIASATNYTNDDTIASVGVDASDAYTNSTGGVDLKSTSQVRIGCAGGSTAYDAYEIYAVVFGA
tara:strand:- start:413 stop:832 length:420 start_codon:yes stop_codon:yes gene_type:complete